MYRRSRLHQHDRVLRPRRLDLQRPAADARGLHRASHGNRARLCAGDAATFLQKRCK